MAEIINLNTYKLRVRGDGTYLALVCPSVKAPRIGIPEEYDGIPITEVRVINSSEPVQTVCISKNVKIFRNTENIQQYNQTYIVEISPENPWLCADDKAVFSKDKTVLYAFTARGDSSYTIPDGVKIIYDCAFYKAFILKELTFPEGLEEIGESVFCWCGVTKLRLPKNVKKIGSEAFARMHYVDELILPEAVEEMSPNAFYNTGCPSAVYVPDCFCKPEFGFPKSDFAPEYIIGENSKTLAMTDGVIYTKDMKTLLAAPQNVPAVLSIPDGVEVIGAGAFDNNKAIREIILPKSVRTVSARAFSQTKLEKINLENVRLIGASAFEACKKLTETGKIGAEIIADRAFCDCPSLGSVHLTNAKEIGESAFTGMWNAEIFLPEGLERLGARALNSNFNSVRIPRSVPFCDGCFAYGPKEVVLYEETGSAIHKKSPKVSGFCDDCLIKVLSPDTDGVLYAVSVFCAEWNETVNSSSEYINSLFGGEQFFDLEKYDEYFSTVFSREHIHSKLKAARYRIKYPHKLTDRHRKTYLEYLDRASATVVYDMLNSYGVTADKIAGFPYLNYIDEDNLRTLIDCSAKLGLTEITAFLMNHKNGRFPNSGILDDEL